MGVVIEMDRRGSLNLDPGEQLKVVCVSSLECIYTLDDISFHRLGDRCLSHSTCVNGEARR
jgi:hypothetical protein